MGSHKAYCQDRCYYHSDEVRMSTAGNFQGYDNLASRTRFILVDRSPFYQSEKREIRERRYPRNHPVDKIA